jgi:signal peptidase
MPPPSSGRRPPDDEPEDDDEDEGEDDEEEEEDEEEEHAPRRRSRPSDRRGRHRARRLPMRRWRASEDEEEEEEEVPPSRRAAPPSRRKQIYWRARDSLYFEPLVALAIIVVLLVSLYAYTQNWPPAYVVESNSMQHGSSDQLGLINAGDLVLAQKTSLSGITSYVSGIPSGYSTYGEYGDVLLYWPDGGGSTPVIHRAILYLEYDPAGSGSYNATDLAGLPCGTGPNDVYSYTPPGSTSINCTTTLTRLTGTLNLEHIGWMSTNITLNLGSSDRSLVLGDHSGFLTMGDNNHEPDQSPNFPGSPNGVLSTLVESSWILGVARGMIPWFGAVKLLLEGQADKVPTQSWEFMGLAIAAVILIAYAIHYALRTEGIETPLRREEEEQARAASEAEAEAASEESAPRRWLSHLRRRRPEDEEEDEREAVRRRRTRPPPPPARTRRGRPVPRVRRGEKPKQATKTSKKRDTDEEL